MLELLVLVGEGVRKRGEEEVGEEEEGGEGEVRAERVK